MSTEQFFKMYEILHRHFNNDADAKIIVQKIEDIIDQKFENEKKYLSTKEDIYLLRNDLFEFKAEMEKRFSAIIIWTVATGLAAVGIMFTLIKLFLVK